MITLQQTAASGGGPGEVLPIRRQIVVVIVVGISAYTLSMDDYDDDSDTRKHATHPPLGGRLKPPAVRVETHYRSTSICTGRQMPPACAVFMARTVI